MNYETVQKPAFTIVGIQIKTDNQRGIKDFPAHWQRFYSENIQEKILHKVDDQVLALYTDYEGDYTKPFSFIIGCHVSRVESVLAADLVSKFIPQAYYAVFTAEGLYPESLINTWMHIWKCNVKRAYKADFEEYEPPKEKGCFIGNHKTVRIFIGID